MAVGIFIKFNRSTQRELHKSTMSHHLFTLFVILTITCALVLGDHDLNPVPVKIVKPRIPIPVKGHGIQIPIIGHGDHHGHIPTVPPTRCPDEHHGHHDHHDHHGHHGHQKHKCHEHEVWSECGAGCQATCKHPKPEVCAKVCVPGCICQKGMLRNKHNKCVKHSAC